ncbi:hypothetical protein [Streptomyces prunicolor]
MSDLGSRAWQMVKQARFAAHDPEQLWSMVEPADGATVTELGDLLTQAATTIKEIGTDLRTHSLAVEWEGEGGEAFRTWIHQAALAALGLGEYSENAGKWLGHAANTLHEVKPQLEILRRQSATARSVLDAHAASATDVGNHDGGPTHTEVTEAKTSYANDSAEAAGQMMKLAQSYSASTEQIGALEAPEFPELPKQFVPTKVDGGTHISAPPSGRAVGRGTTTQAPVPGRKAAIATGSSGTSAAPQVTSRHHTAGLPAVPDATPGRPADTTNTAIDSASTLPSAPPSTSGLPSGSGGGDSRTSSSTGLLSPALSAGTTIPSGVRGIEGRSVYGGRGPVPTASGSGTSGSSRVPGRGLTGPYGSGMPGSQPIPGRGQAVPGAARGANGITGGRPLPPPSGRTAGAIPRGTVIGGTASEQQSPTGRGTVPGGGRTGATPYGSNGRTANPESAAKSARLPAQSDGIVGGQPRTSRQRGRAGSTSPGAGLVRGTDTPNTGDARRQSIGTAARGASAVTRAPYGGDHSARSERSRNRTDQRAEDGEGRSSTPRLPSGPDEHPRREG